MVHAWRGRGGAAWRGVAAIGATVVRASFHVSGEGHRARRAFGEETGVGER